MTNKESRAHRRYAAILLAIYLPFWVWLAVEPIDRVGWLLENLFVFLFIPLLSLTYRQFRLSNVSYTAIFLFMVLHAIGGHYTYGKVPLGNWLMEWFGFARNHYDRIVHFSFGLLMSYPVREVFHRIAQTRGVWGYWLPLELTLAFSAIFEILEWLIVLIAAPEAGTAYLGTQGDEFDAIKDMALAGSGAFLTMLVTLCVNWKYDRNFAAKIKRSVEPKEQEPLGEVRLQKLKEQQQSETNV